MLVKDNSYKWQTINFRDAQPILESEVVYSPKLLPNGSPDPSDPLSYTVGKAYTIEYSQTPDRDVDLVPGTTIIRVVDNIPPARGVQGDYYRLKADVTTGLSSILADENYKDATRWEHFTSNPGSDANTADSDYENYSQDVKRWSTGGGWLRKKTLHTEVTTISGLTDYYTHSLKADYPIEIAFVGSTATPSLTINSVGNIILQGDVDVPSGTPVVVNSSNGSVFGASTVGFYGSTPRLTVAGDVDINVETGNQPLWIQAGGNVIVDGITNSIGVSGGAGEGSAANLIEIEQIDASGDVFVFAADGIIAKNSSSFIHGDQIELKTNRGGIGTNALPIAIDSNIYGHGGLAAYAEGDIYIVETAGTLKLLSPEQFSSAENSSDTMHNGVSVRSLLGKVFLTTSDGDIMDDIKETYSAPTADQINALNVKLALFGAEATKAAQLQIRNEENLATERYHSYWLNERTNTPSSSNLDIASVDFATDTVTTNTPHGLQSGAQLLSSGGSIGLTSGFTYYAVVIDATHFKLAPSRFDAAIAVPHDNSNPDSGRIIDLVAGFDFNAAQLTDIVLEHFTYTSSADTVTGPISGVLDAWRIGNYNGDFVYSMPQAEKDAIIAARVRQATEVANPISATLRRDLYPESFVFSSVAPGTSNETLNISAAGITLVVGDPNPAVTPPSGRVGTLDSIQTLELEYGINGTPGHPSLLTLDQKELLSSAIVDDVIGKTYVTYRYIGSAASSYNFQASTHDFNDATKWTRVDPTYITSVNTSPVMISANQTVLVELDSASYGWYTFVGSTSTISLAVQNYTDTSLWQRVSINHTTQETLRLVGDAPSTVRSVSLATNDLVADTTTVNRLTIQVVDDVNVEVLGTGRLSAAAKGDIAIQATGELKVDQVITPGDIRLSASGNLIDVGTGIAAITSLGKVNLEGQVVQGNNVGIPMRVLVGPSGSLSGVSAGDFRIQQGNGSFTVDGVNATFGDLTVTRTFSGGTTSIEATDGNLTIGKLESSTGFALTATDSILDGGNVASPDEWNLFGPIATLTAAATSALATMQSTCD